VFKSAADNRLIPIGQPASLSSIRSRNKLNGVELLWLVALLVFKSAADNRLHPKRQQASLRSNRSRNKLNGVELFIGVQFHSGSGKNCRWQYSDAGEPQQFFIGKGAIQGESCSEQAFAHLFARHDDSRERQVAPLVSRSEEFKAAARKEEALVWNPLSTLLQ
jgi:hypothetical protein